MKVKEVMSKNVITCTKDELVIDAVKRMLSYDIGLLVVVEDNLSKHVVGVLSDRDVLTRLVVKGLDPEKIKVGKVMTEKVASARPDESMNVAADRMKKEKVKRLVVYDESGILAGIVSNSDVMKEFAEIRKRLLDLTAGF